MAVTSKRWRLKPQGDPDAVQRMTNDRCPTELARLLVQRGIDTPEVASLFFRPAADQLLDPFLMKDMDRAVERIERALGDAERIMIYGDYDVDGTTAVALVHGFLRGLVRSRDDLFFHIPDRYAEGYGISRIGIDRAHALGVTLIIALDCGIKAHDKVEHARSLGIDMIICDHHLPDATIPEAYAVLDPKRPDCPYPFKELSGCGIGFKLMQALAQHNDIPFADLEPQLDLVAISTACDIVPVTGENRVLSHLGLQRLNSGQVRPGIQVMLDLTNFNRAMTVTDLVFVIGPRINAAGRIEHGQQAVELLLSNDPKEAENIGLRINANNSTRQGLDKDTTEQALGMIASDPALADAWSTVVFDPGWHKGVIGIVASRLIEHHYRPTVVLTESNGKVSGSARSVKGFDLYEAISACADLLDQYGGHTFAAGLTMDAANIPAFKERFEQVVRAKLDERLRSPEEEVDLEIPFDRIDERFVRNVQRMAPFGPHNMRPVFLLRGVVDDGRARIVGQDHLKLRLRMPGSDRAIDAIGFRMGHLLPLLNGGKPFSVLCSVEMNSWQDRESVQLNIRDIKPGTDDVIEEALELAQGVQA